MKRKMLSLLLVLCLMCSFLPQIATTVSAGIYGPDCGPELTWSLDADTGVLTVSGTGEMYNYVNTDEQLCAPWLPQSDSILSVVIEDGVTSIGTNAFNGCKNLTTVAMGKDVTIIGEKAFYGCTSLMDVTTGFNIDVIGEYAFSYCDSLAKIEIFAKTISAYAFGMCPMLQEVILGSDVQSVGDAAFMGCDNLDSFRFPAGVTYIGQKIFGGGDNMKDVQIDENNPNYTVNEEGILFSKDQTIVYDCFYNMSGDYTLPEGVTEIYSQAFAFKEGLTAITLPESLRKIGHGAFNGCSGLTELTLPSDLTEIGEGAFMNCSGITEITIPKGVNRIEQNVFTGCTSLKKIHVAEGHPFYFSDEQGILYYTRKDTGRDEVYLCPEGYTGSCTIPASVSHVDSRAFYHCTGLTELEFHGYSTSLGDEVFFGCDNLEKITFYSQMVFLSDIVNTFYGCDNLKEIYFYGAPPSPSGLKIFPEGVTLYYIEGVEGWSSPTWNDCSTATFKGFTDVLPGAYFYDSVLWAVDQEITNGTGKGKFSPDKDCTRGQIVTFLWRAAGCPEPVGTENPFTDVPADAYYYKAVLWAVENGITTGTTAEKFAPEATCTRGQVATFLWRAAGKPAAENQENPFKDLDAEAYYYDAVLWAVEKKITTGTTAEKFAPEATCTRGQIVTFLYRGAQN